MVHGFAGCAVPWLYGAMLQRSSEHRIVGTLDRSAGVRSLTTRPVVCAKAATILVTVVFRRY